MQLPCQTVLSEPKKQTESPHRNVANFWPFVVATSFLFVWAIGCSEKPSASRKIHVLVASSAASATKKVAQAYISQLPDDSSSPEIIISSGPSSGLAQQIRAGAPADIYLSADIRWIEELEDRCHATKNVLGNRLVLATGNLNQMEITGVADLAEDTTGKIAVAGKSVPVGHYANQFIASLPDPIHESIRQKLVFAKDSAALVAWLESNQVDAGLIYASDANRSANLQLIEMIGEDSHAPIVYAVTKIKNENLSEVANSDDFFSWLESEEAQAIYREFGFSAP